MTKERSDVSLKETVFRSIGDFLWAQGFKTNDILQEGILDIINQISDYHEERTPLQPHIIITNNIKVFDTIPHKEILIRDTDLSLNEFKEILKLCAPLAINNWFIFIEVSDRTMRYGLASAEMTETSLSIYSQTVGRLGIAYEGIAIAYLRKVAKKTVELSGIGRKVVISLTLDAPSNEGSFSEIAILSEQIVLNCPEKYKPLISTFFEKIIIEALRLGHGNLIAVIDDNEESINHIKKRESKCVYLPRPVDFLNLFIDAESLKTNESSINLNSHASLLQSMLNHDGITILTNKGRLIGYHLLINDHTKPEQSVGGGTRSKAFASMQNCGYFNCCFFKSQDGNTKIFVK